MIVLLLACIPTPLEGDYQARVGTVVSSCYEEDYAPWYSLDDGLVRLAVEDAASGTSFSFDVESDNESGTLPCDLEEDTFDCEKEVVGEAVYIDDVLATGVWTSDGQAEVWWTMARYCDGDEDDKTACVENGTRSCGITTHLTLTYSGGQ